MDRKASQRAYYRANKEKINARNREHYVKNKERINAAHRLYYVENKEAVLQRCREYEEKHIERVRQRKRAHRAKNLERVRAYHRAYCSKKASQGLCAKHPQSPAVLKGKCDICAVKNRITRRLHKSLRSRDAHSYVNIRHCLGCSLGELIAHLQTQFRPGMTWDNMGKWHIDHIVPLASANDAADIERLNHYTNLQPLWKSENLLKGSLHNGRRYRLGAVASTYQKGTHGLDGQTETPVHTGRCKP